MKKSQLQRFEGKKVTIITFSGDCFTGVLTRAYINSVWMEEGYHINTDSIHTCHEVR